MKTKPFKPTKTFARKIVKLVSCGLTKGVGNPKEGQLCIMAAFNLALGRPHGDSGLEDCVGDAVRSFDIKLNDCAWSSNDARARGMLRESVAKIGSNQVDQNKFSELLCVKGVQQILPVMFRVLAGRDDCKDKAGFIAHAKECEGVNGIDEAKAVAKSAYASTSAYAYAYAYASTSAYAYAYAYASTSAYASAYASAYWNEKLGVDFFLKLSAEIAVEALIELKSPGCQWLDLCES